MNDPNLLYDLIRFVLGVAALVLAAMVVRLGYLRFHDGRRYHVHPAAYFSYALALTLLAFLRLSHIGDRPTWDLWVACMVVASGWYAVLTRASFHTAPPWRRRDGAGRHDPGGANRVYTPDHD